MKIKQLLIGLIVCTFVTGTIVATSKTSIMNSEAYQTSKNQIETKMAKSASDKIIEVGPNNIAGRVRGMIFDNRDNTNQTMFAGGVAGGLFKTTDGGLHWNRIPLYSANGEEITLPISCMTQTSDGVIYIGTGEGFLPNGGNNFDMAPVGRGLYRFVDENTYSVVPITKPISDTITEATGDWYAINKLATIEYNNVNYLYVATNTGLFRWKLQADTDINNTPMKVFSGKVTDIDISSHKGLLYFTTANNIYRIGSITNDAQTYVNVSANYIDSNNASRIEVAIAPSNENYVYASVADTAGLLKAVYLTTNQQVWNVITTNTVTIFSANNSGATNNSISVFPDNPKKIAVGGNSLWVGEGFEGATLYTWTKSAYTEDELNSGDYMNSVYVSTQFVHSGIHSIQFSGSDPNTFYMATDGGIFKTTNGGSSFSMCNRGLNTTQFYSVAVANDASVLGGAQGNSVPFIQSRNDSDNGDFNQTAQVLWFGDGGGVASSCFQLITPISRRALFVSANGSLIGRAYSDYSDYTNTQTWTMGSDFNNGKFSTGPSVTSMLLWETTNNTIIRDSISVTIDSTTIIYHDTTHYVQYGDEAIVPGDTIVVKSRAHFDYPFRYVFTETKAVTRDGLTIKIQNPIQNRLYVTTKNALGKNVIFMTTAPTDFTKDAESMPWYPIIAFGAKSELHAMAISKDGNTLYASLDEENGSRLVRIKNLLYGTNANELSYYVIVADSNSTNPCVLAVDTIEFNGSKLLPRTITSIATDPKGGDNIVVTCGGYNDTIPNAFYITNASTNTYVAEGKTLVSNKMPLYSSLIEDSTGNIYVGTENGLFITEDITVARPTWTTFGNFVGTPIFAITQQTNNMPCIKETYVSGVNSEEYIWGKTKYPRAIYYATYGRGIFMDTTYVTDHTNEIAINEAVNSIASNNSVKLYPNPATNFVKMDLNIVENSYVDIQMFDLSGRVVMSKSLGNMQAGVHSQIIPCQDMKKGIYVVKVIAGNQTMTSKLIVK